MSGFSTHQLDAAVKIVGGLNYTYAVRGDGQTPARPVGGAMQREALHAVLDCLSPALLDLPESTLALLVPRPFGYRSHRELFKMATSPAFDAL